MKLVPKLASALIAGTALVLAANAYFRIEREVHVLQVDRTRDHALLGGVLGAAVSSVWRSNGREEALQAVAGATGRGGRVHVRWIDADTASGALDPGTAAALGANQTTTRVQGDVRYSYTAVVVDSHRVGYIELSESIDPELQARRTIVNDTLTTTLMLVLVCGALSTALGLWLVGRPVRDLCAKARRIGLGDFTSPLQLRQKDELGMLAEEVNAMCDRLLEANRRVERETTARIATLEQLRHADRLMTVGMLASGVAHELGTPLNVVMARAQMLEAGDCGQEEVKDYARAIGDAASRMTKIIKQLLAFARRKSPQKAPRDLRRIVVDTTDLLRPIADKQHVDLVLPPDATEQVLQVDGDGIQQAITNIIMNAVHSMPRGGKVEISFDREARPALAEHPGHYLVIRIKDHGGGIAPEHLDHIFEPFFTTKGVGEGTGLGLSVTHGIIEDHGGFMDVQSGLGEGSIFGIHLPLPESA